MLAALDAVVDVVGPNGHRTVPLGEFIVGFYETVLESSEIAVGVRIPIPEPGTAAVYEKFSTRSSEDRPCVGVAAVVRLQSDGLTCADLRVSVGAATETPQRFADVEQAALGQRLDPELVDYIADRYASDIDPLSDMRGSDWYRRRVTRVFVQRAIDSAAAIARGASTGRS
jgi:carbon-monoxide dehydrogenase medium subunit